MMVKRPMLIGVWGTSDGLPTCTDWFGLYDKQTPVPLRRSRETQRCTPAVKYGGVVSDSPVCVVAFFASLVAILVFRLQRR